MKLYNWLINHKDATPNEICLAFNISQPTFSRMVRAAGERVVAYGAKANKRYTAQVGKAQPIYQVNALGKVLSFGTLTPVLDSRYVLSRHDGRSATLHHALPWFLADMRPQGFLGKQFVARIQDLNLPNNPNHWHESMVLQAISLRGEDFPGQFIVGEASLDRYLRAQHSPPVIVSEQDYFSQAQKTLTLDTGYSSVGGEQPKFTAFDGQQHLIIKFSPLIENPVSLRWADLLICEALANQTLRAFNVPASESKIIVPTVHAPQRVFHVSSRFDRTPLGRRGVLSLGALDDEWVGRRHSWSDTAERLCSQKRICAATRDAMMEVELFAAMIGNTDRHFGNLALMSEDYQTFSLAPIYDMLPMAFAPSAQGELLPTTLHPPLPNPTNINAWLKAYPIAQQFWQTAQQSPMLSPSFHTIAVQCAESLAACLPLADKMIH